MGIGICLLLGTALLGQPPKDTKQLPPELRGVWRLDSAEAEAGAIPLPESRPTISIEGDRLVYGGETAATATADGATDPKVIDLRFGENDYEGIYAVDKDTLKICLNGHADGAKERPDGFKTEGHPARRLLTFTRVKPEEAGPGVGFVGLMLSVDDASKTVVVQDLLEGSPAKKSSLKKGDLLLEVGGMAVDNLRAAVDAVRRAKPKSELVLRVRRDGAEQEIKVKVGLLPLTVLFGLD